MKTSYIRALGALGSALVLSTLSAVATPSSTRRATVCNGHADLCARSYGALAYVGTHNSYAVGVNLLAANQDHNITQQLNDGVRMLQVQAHDEDGVVKLCHTDCRLYDGGSFKNYLTTVKSWLDANPNEVLSLLIVNSNNLPASTYGAIYAETGLDVISYRPPSSPLPAAEWPTLGELIDTNQRVVSFLSTTANMAEVPYLIDEFANVWETAFNVLDPNLFDCTVNRTRGDSSTQLFLINHFLDKLVLGQPVPDIAKLNVTNAQTGFGSLGAHVETCVALHGRVPNFLLVDYYEFGAGSVFEVAAGINGVTYAPATPIVEPMPTAVGTQTRAAADSGGAALPPLLQGAHWAAGMSLLVGSALIAPLLVF